MSFNFNLAIPHAGTHCAMIFLGTLYNQVERVGVGETNNGIIQSLLDGNITEDTFIGLIKALRIVWPEPPYLVRDIIPLLSSTYNRKFLSKIFDQKYKHLFYFSHLVPDFYEKSWWPQDLVDSGKVEWEYIFAPLRCPIIVSLSTYLLVGDSSVDYNNFHPPKFPGLSPYIWWTMEQFQTLLTWKNKYGDKVKFLPVDLYNRLLIEDRLIRSTKLIHSMGLEPTNTWEDWVRGWRRANPFHREAIQNYRDITRMLNYLMLKNELEQGHGLTSFGRKDELVQWLIDKYKRVRGLQEMFEAEGYTNLCWFK